MDVLRQPGHRVVRAQLLLPVRFRGVYLCWSASFTPAVYTFPGFTWYPLDVVALRLACVGLLSTALAFFGKTGDVEVQRCTLMQRAVLEPFECLLRRCGNVAAILELDENLSKYFKVIPQAARRPCTALCSRNQSCAVQHLFQVLV